MIWDMGEIASSDSTGRVELFRRVVLASAGIPAEIVIQSQTAFDRKYMKSLFSLGLGMSVSGYSRTKQLWK